MDQGKSPPPPPAGLEAYIVFIVCIAVSFFFHIYFGVITTFAYMSLAAIIFAFCNIIVSPNTYDTESISIRQTVRPVAKIKPVLRDNYDNLNYLHRRKPNSSAFQPLRRLLLTSFLNPQHVVTVSHTRTWPRPRYRLQIAKMMLIYIYY